MIRLRRLAVPAIALALAVPGATVALTPVETVPLYVSGRLLACHSIGGCAYRITTQHGESAPETIELDVTDDWQLVPTHGALQVPAGPLSVMAEGLFVSDAIRNGEREIGPTFATCRLTADVPPDQRGVELTLVVTASACILDAAPSERDGPEAPPSPRSPLLALHPLPDGLDPAQARPPLVTLMPSSPRVGVAAGVPFATNLGHCGLGSPVDVDGAFWDPIGGIDAAMGPVDSEDEWSELINGTAVDALLVGADRLDLRTPLGSVLVLARHEGPGDYPMCD